MNEPKKIAHLGVVRRLANSTLGLGSLISVEQEETHIAEAFNARLSTVGYFHTLQRRV
ncbi:MAG: hypothetical protein OXP71_04050 [Candidatus Poribacteria bacterium]|nr:hypothetical protein [Candidatus Poribacteria bacterium]